MKTLTIELQALQPMQNAKLSANIPFLQPDGMLHHNHAGVLVIATLQIVDLLGRTFQTKSSDSTLATTPWEWLAMNLAIMDIGLGKSYRGKATSVIVDKSVRTILVVLASAGIR